MVKVKIMKKFFVLCAVLFSSVVTAETNVAVLDLQSAILKTDKAEQKLSALEKNPEYAALVAKYESLRADLESMGKDAQTNNLTWSQKDKDKFRKKAEYKRADLKLAGEKLKAENNTVLQQVIQELAPKARKAVTAIVKAEKIDIVLDRKAALHADPAVNITGKVTAKLNKM